MALPGSSCFLNAPHSHNLKPFGGCASNPFQQPSLTFDKAKRKGGRGNTEVLGTQEQSNQNAKLGGAFEEITFVPLPGQAAATAASN